MLTLHTLTTGYRHTIISRNLNATLPQGTLTALLGTNGAGKSTLLRTLARFQPPLAGSISWQGTDTAQLSARQLARTMSVVLTFKPEAEALTAAEVVEMGRIPYTTMLSGTTETDRQAVEQAMQLTHTTPFAHRPISTLSDGERQRVFIAKALAQNTPVILLDEPTAFLDFPAKIATMRLLKKLAHDAQKTILLSTHDVELALHMADNLWLLNQQTLTSGSPQLLAANGCIGRFFNTEGVQFDAATMRFDMRD